MRSPYLIQLVTGLALFTLSQNLSADPKLGCKEVESIETKCKDYDAQTTACEAVLQTAGKAKIDEAKKEDEDCKTKHGMQYIMKCKAEIKKVKTLVNTPKQMLNSGLEKEQLALPESPCTKADAIGKEQKLCKAPKKVVETMKKNCIKDM